MVCNATVVFGQWSCSTLAASSDIPTLAALHGVHPDRLYDYNSLSLPGPSSIVPAGFNLRVPGAPCEAVGGVWDCYTVQHGDTFESITSSNITTVRSVDALVSINEDLLWGSDTLFAGMELRIPQPFCVPGRTHECHDVILGETLDSIASLYGADAGTLFDMNQDVLGGYEELNAGMELKFPRRHATPPVPCVPIPGFWDCYSVQGGDTLFDIAAKLQSNPDKICEVNGLEDCDNVFVGQNLAVPVFSCTPKANRWTCYTHSLPGSTNFNIIAFQHSNNAGGFEEFKDANSWQLAVDAVQPWIYPNQEVLFPYLHCRPSASERCHYFGETDSFRSIAAAGDYNEISLYQIGANRDIAFTVGASSMWLPAWSVPLSSGGVDTASRGRLAAAEDEDCPLFSPNFVGSCVDTPGSHFCYKVQFQDTAFVIAQSFGLSQADLCDFNSVPDCRCLAAADSALKIPIVA